MSGTAPVSSMSGTCTSRGRGRRSSGTRPCRPAHIVSAPSRSARLPSTSAVAQMIRASALTAASPVSIPTRSAPEQIAQVEELLGHQRLDRCGVEGTAPLPRKRTASPHSDQALPGSGRGTDDRVRSRGQFGAARPPAPDTAVDRPARPGRELFQQFLRLPRTADPPNRVQSRS